MAGLAWLGPAISIECLLTGIASFAISMRVEMAGTSRAMTGLESQSFRRLALRVLRETGLLAVGLGGLAGAPSDGKALHLMEDPILPTIDCLSHQ